MISIGMYSYRATDRKQRTKNTTDFHQISVKGYSKFRIFLAQCRLLGMRKYAATTIALILLIFWPTMAQDIDGTTRASTPDRVHTQFEENYLKELDKRKRNPNFHGLYVESLDGSVILADHRSHEGFNPASVIKVATSFAALDKLGADYRFETTFEIAGEINKKTRTLQGDLILVSNGDPDLTTARLNLMIRDVVRAGIHKVTGSLVINGPFTYGPYITTTSASTRVTTLLKRQGIRVSKPTKRGSQSGVVLSTHVSEPLRKIIWEQNAHSDNRIAERLGVAIGGPEAVRQFLIRGVGIPEKEITIATTSGLDINRITPHGTVQLLRHLVLWLNFNNLLPQDVLPVAGVDVGTLRTRFTTVDYRGSVIGKTGTLPVTDGGVSTLAGFVYTRDRGVLLFAIFDTRGNVNSFRKLQDKLIKELIDESGGTELSASLHKSGN
ncbi:MAG TPA: D-alanyl-D-alanine carboxypeptidase [Terriglobia bacterium]|nr:D-alanyl-D-alanine carboxypeptidase [Terriglobia bacterium]